MFVFIALGVLAGLGIYFMLRPKDGNGKDHYTCDDDFHCKVDNNGKYLSKSECTADCKSSNGKDHYTCGDDYQCTVDAAGKYLSKSECLESCHSPSAPIKAPTPQNISLMQSAGDYHWYFFWRMKNPSAYIYKVDIYKERLSTGTPERSIWTNGTRLILSSNEERAMAQWTGCVTARVAKQDPSKKYEDSDKGCGFGVVL